MKIKENSRILKLSYVFNNYEDEIKGIFLLSSTGNV